MDITETCSLKRPVSACSLSELCQLNCSTCPSCDSTKPPNGNSFCSSYNVSTREVVCPAARRWTGEICYRTQKLCCIEISVAQNLALNNIQVLSISNGERGKLLSRSKRELKVLCSAELYTVIKSMIICLQI